MITKTLTLFNICFDKNDITDRGSKIVKLEL